MNDCTRQKSPPGWLPLLTLAGLSLAGSAPYWMSVATATERPDQAPVHWQLTLDEPDAELEHLAGAVGVSGDLWLVVGRREDGVLGGPHELELWHLDAQGSKAQSEPLAWDGAPPIQSQRAMQMRWTPAAVLLALQTDDGAYIISRPNDGGEPAPGHVTAASEAALMAMGTALDGQPVLVTSRGLVSFDADESRWVQSWSKPRDSLIVAAAAAGNGRFGVLSQPVDPEELELTLTALQLSTDNAVSTQSVPLGQGSFHALGKSMVALDGGAFAVADPYAMADGVRWRLTTVDASVNLVGAADTDLPSMDLPRTRLASWGSSVVLAATEAAPGGPALFMLDKEGRSVPWEPAPGPATDWHKTIRLDIYPMAGGDAYLVESARAMEQNGRSTRSAINIQRLSRNIQRQPASHKDAPRPGENP